MPLQARGHERRRTILDAAAAILCEASTEAVTMHAVAARARTSVGSMYHFFRDREEVLQALGERHAIALDELADESAGIDDAQWRRMSVAEVVARLFGRTIAYLARHPDALATLTMRKDARLAAFQARVEHVMQLRCDDPRMAHATASTLFAAAAGTLLFARDQQDLDHRHAIAEIPVLLTAYLERLESRPALQTASDSPDSPGAGMSGTRARP